MPCVRCGFWSGGCSASRWPGRAGDCGKQRGRRPGKRCPPPAALRVPPGCRAPPPIRRGPSPRSVASPTRRRGDRRLISLRSLGRSIRHRSLLCSAGALTPLSLINRRSPPRTIRCGFPCPCRSPALTHQIQRIHLPFHRPPSGPRRRSRAPGPNRHRRASRRTAPRAAPAQTRRLLPVRRGMAADPGEMEETRLRRAGALARLLRGWEAAVLLASRPPRGPPA